MTNVYFSITCAMCGHEWINDNQDDPAMIKINFDSGIMSYICQNCNHYNEMQFLNDKSVKASKKLPGIKRGY